MPEVPRHDPAAGSGELDRLHRQVAHLEQAVVSHERVAFACGLLAHRFGCSSDQAWQVMIRLSQTTNVKLSSVAQILTDAHCHCLAPADEETAATLEGLLSRRSIDPVASTAVHRGRA